MLQSSVKTEDNKTSQEKVRNDKPTPSVDYDAMMDGHTSVGLMNAPVQRALADEEEHMQAKLAADSPIVQNKQEEEEQAKNGATQMKSGNPGKGSGNTSSGSSKSMPDSLTSKMENSFGTDFKDVNVHTNSESATNIGALAYTQGSDIHFAPGQYNPDSKTGQELIGHELTHVVQQKSGRVNGTQNKGGFNINTEQSLENEADNMGRRAASGRSVSISGTTDTSIQRAPETVDAAPVQTPEQIIKQAFDNYKSGNYTMPDLGKALLPYVSTHDAKIIEILDGLPVNHRDNLCYSMASNSDDTQLATFAKPLLLRMQTELGGILNTTSWGENHAQRDRVTAALGTEVAAEPTTPTLAEQAAEDLEFMQTLFNHNISGGVGANRDNKAVDVKHIARGLLAKGYTVPDTALNDGICNDAFIEVIKKFQTEVQNIESPDGAVDANGETIKKIFDKANNSYNSGIANMFGVDVGGLNSSIEGSNPLKRWIRTEAFNDTTNKYDYTIENADFIDRETYAEHIEKLAEAKGVEENSDEAKAIGMAAKAASDDAYFNELTQDVGFEFIVSNPSSGSHTVNSILVDRLTRFHKFLSAVGLFRGNMGGSATVNPAYKHKICIAHVILSSTAKRSQDKKDSITDNLIKVYNGETVAGGSKATNGNVKDSDGHIFAKSTHFETDAEGKATAMKTDDWHTYLKTFDPARDWDVYYAEGYKRGDSKRFPLGINKYPDRSNHIPGDAIDVNHHSFTRMNEAMVDLIALNFGLIRNVDDEQWHFECTNIQLSTSERALIEAESNTRESLES